MEKRSSGESENVIFGLEDALVEKNMDIEVSVTDRLTGFPTGISLSTFSQAPTANTSPKADVSQEGTKAGAAPKPPAKITMNIPTLFQKNPAAAVPPRKIAELQQIKASSPVPITVTKPLVAATTSTIQVPVPNTTSPKTNSPICKAVISPTPVTVISPTAATVSTSNSVGNVHLLGAQQTPISKIPAVDPLDSNSLVAHATSPDPLLFVPVETSAMQISPLDSVSEPILFDSNSLLTTCSLPGCDNVKSGNVTVFNFPRNRARRWCEILGIPHEGIPLKDLGGLKICGGHFDPSEFVENSAGKELKLTAMPMPLSKPKQMLPQLTKLEESTPLSKVPVKSVSANSQKVLTLPNINILGGSSSLTSEAFEKSLLSEVPESIVLPSNCYLQPIPTTNTIGSNLTIRPSHPEIIVTNLETGKVTVGHPRMPMTLTKTSILNTGMQNINVRGKTPINTSTVGPNTTTAITANTMRLRGSGPKSQRKAALSPLNPVVPLGPYTRPSIKLRSSEVKADDLANLVMPTEDWSVNVYASMHSRPGKGIFTLSETILNSDYIEIVRKSITIQPSWAMKFSVMSRDMSHFNLGLAVSDVSDVQAVLENFASLSLCKGLTEISLVLDSRRNSSLPIRAQVERYVDNVYRSIECPLLLVGSSGSNTIAKVCSACRSVMQSFNSNSTTKITR